MNDRFRFRVWSVCEKEMIYNAEIAYDGTNYPTEWQLGENNNDGWICCFGEYIDRKKYYKVMQCIGLKDKNGQLIYEGDIVKLDSEQSDIHIAKVIYRNGCFGLSAKKWVSYFNFLKPSRWKIIGNIHENPELLEDK